jgi:hypothetical protein
MLNDVTGRTRLQAVQQATAQFLRDPASIGVGVGIGYFGTQPPSFVDNTYGANAIGWNHGQAGSGGANATGMPGMGMPGAKKAGKSSAAFAGWVELSAAPQPAGDKVRTWK